MSGEFQTANLPALASGLAWHLAYNPTDISLAVLFSADFNADGNVDNLDLTDWQIGYGMQTAAHEDGDADGDGDADAADFLMWQRQFGSSSLLPPLAVSVPEPHAIQLLASLMLMIAFACRPKHL